MEILRAEHVSYSYQTKYQKVEAVRDVSCTFEQGNFYAIIGESGSGKEYLSLPSGGAGCAPGGYDLCAGKIPWDHGPGRLPAESGICGLSVLPSVPAPDGAGKRGAGRSDLQASPEPGGGAALRRPGGAAGKFRPSSPEESTCCRTCRSAPCTASTISADFSGIACCTPLRAPESC